MSVDIGSIYFLVTIYDHADLLKSEKKEWGVTLRDQDVLQKTADSKILDSPIREIQRIIVAKFRLDPNKTGVILSPHNPKSFTCTKGCFFPYISVNHLRRKLKSPIGTISARLHATVYPLPTIDYRRINWLRSWGSAEESIKPPLHPLTKHRKFTFKELTPEPEEV